MAAIPVLALWAQIVIGFVIVLFVVAAFSPSPKDKTIAAGQAPTTVIEAATRPILPRRPW